jgi:hypothetical protein
LILLSRNEMVGFTVRQNCELIWTEFASIFAGDRGAFRQMRSQSGKSVSAEKNDFKKTMVDYAERDEEKRAEFECKISEMPPEMSVVYLDESGIDRYISRPYARTPRGKAITILHPGKRYKRLKRCCSRVR